MGLPDKIEAVKKVSETVGKDQSLEEKFTPNKDHFDNLMNSTQKINPSFEHVNPAAQVQAPEEVQPIENNPIYADENVTSQKSGSATDQDGRRRRQQEIEEVEGVSGKRTNKASASTKSSSLMDEVSKLNKNVSSISKGSAESIKTQAKETIAQMESLKTKLSQVQTEIKPSYQTLLRNRLTHIDDNLKIALNKAGIEYTPPATVEKGNNQNALHKFIGFLTNSQNQLENLDQSIEKISTTKDITPANMLAIQMKMTQIQQQIELFTSLLNKALESTKTIMNVQI